MIEMNHGNWFDQTFKCMIPYGFLNLSKIIFFDLEIRHSKFPTTLQQPFKFKIQSFQVEFISATLQNSSSKPRKQLWSI
jgi:hypothetical protein